MRTVEFFGAPGAGKTVIARATAAALRARGFLVAEPVAQLNERPSIYRAPEKLARVVLESARSPQACAGLARAVIASRQPNLVVASKILANFLVQRSLAVAERDADVAICDQGLFQAIWSLNLEARRPAFDDELFRLLARDTGARLVLFLDADVEHVLKRLASRSDPGRFAKTADASSGLFSRSADLAERLWQRAQSLAERGRNLSLSRIDNRAVGLDAAIELAVAAVLDFVR
jgi:predicted kinase